MKLKLKKLQPGEEYDIKICATNRCNVTSAIIIATKQPHYGLCDYHWELRCDEGEEDVRTTNKKSSDEEARGLEPSQS